MSVPIWLQDNENDLYNFSNDTTPNINKKVTTGKQEEEGEGQKKKEGFTKNWLDESSDDEDGKGEEEGAQKKAYVKGQQIDTHASATHIPSPPLKARPVLQRPPGLDMGSNIIEGGTSPPNDGNTTCGASDSTSTPPKHEQPGKVTASKKESGKSPAIHKSGEVVDLGEGNPFQTQVTAASPPAHLLKKMQQRSQESEQRRQEREKKRKEEEANATSSPGVKKSRKLGGSVSSSSKKKGFNDTSASGVSSNNSDAFLNDDDDDDDDEFGATHFDDNSPKKTTATTTTNTARNLLKNYDATTEKDVPLLQTNTSNASFGSPQKGYPLGVGVGIEDQVSQQVDLSIVAPLSEGDKSLYATVIEFFGLATIEKLRSVRFQHRVTALEEIEKQYQEDIMKLTSTSSPSKKGDDTEAKGVKHAKQVQQIIFGDVLAVSFSDPVMQVFHTAYELCQTLLKHITLFSQEILEGGLKAATTAVIKRLKDSNSRIRNSAVDLLMAMSKHQGSGLSPVYVIELMCHEGTQNLPMTLSSPASSPQMKKQASESLASSSSQTFGAAESNWKSLLTKMTTVSSILSTDKNLYFSCKEPLMRLAVSGLNCSNPKVRKTAMSFAAEVYKAVGNSVELYLTNVSAATVRSLKQLLEQEGVCITETVMHLTTADRQEEEDISAFDSEGTSLSEEQLSKLDTWANDTKLRSCKCLFSHRWKLRVQFVERVDGSVALSLAGSPGQRGDVEKERLLSASDTSTITTLGQICQKALEDTVPAVISAALILVGHTMKFLSANYSSGNSKEKQTNGSSSSSSYNDSKATVVDNLLPLLFRHAGHSATCEQTTNLILDIVDLEIARPSRITASIFQGKDYWLQNDLHKTAPKLITPRLDILAGLVAQCGFEEGGISLDDCMKYVLLALHHPQLKVRASAINVVIEVYKAAGTIVQSYLSELKGSILEELKDKIANVARKDRSKTAPIHRLANMIEPLGMASAGGGMGGLETNPQQPNSARPATFDAQQLKLNESGSSGGGGGAKTVASSGSIRQRILQYNEEKKKKELRMQQGGHKEGGAASSDEEDSEDDHCEGPLPMHVLPQGSGVNLLRPQGSKGSRSRIVFPS